MNILIDTQKYTERVSNALKASLFIELESVASILLEARKNNRWIFLAGNGGSASTASHFANDMMKGLSIIGKPRFRAKALCEAMPIITALANDYNYDLIYVEQLKNYASTG
ncbi:MAG TPA: SIS domain-containing protein, partial [Clostridiales bacterium]|nr:SIS domain-containing protein [Clostridiales bacterium]